MADDSTVDEDWAGVTPIPQDDGPNPVVKIAYSSTFTRLMDLFRGVVAIGEYSLRVLDLTQELLEENAANYTVWQYRRECLRKLNSNLYEELDYLDGFSRDNPKNYQIWHHRRTVVEWLGDGDRELEFCNEVFKVDAKNYHAWAHRQWALRTFNLWEGELAFIEECLNTDVRNNSAWNQRWYYVHHGPEMVTSEVVLREVSFAWDSLLQRGVTQNESAWNYLRGLAKTHKEEAAALVKERCAEMVERSGQQNVLAMGLLADLCEEEADALLLCAQELPTPPAAAPTEVATVEGAAANSATLPSAPLPPSVDQQQQQEQPPAASQLLLLQSLLTQAEALCVRLVSQDAIRAKSWTRRVLSLHQKKAEAEALF